MTLRRRSLLIFEMDDRLRRQQRNAAANPGDVDAQRAFAQSRRRGATTEVNKKRPMLGRGHTARTELPDGVTLYSSSVRHDGWWGVHHGHQEPDSKDVSDHGHDHAHKLEYGKQGNITKDEPPHPDKVREFHEKYVDRFLNGQASSNHGS